MWNVNTKTTVLAWLCLQRLTLCGIDEREDGAAKDMERRGIWWERLRLWPVPSAGSSRLERLLKPHSCCFITCNTVINPFTALTHNFSPRQKKSTQRPANRQFARPTSIRSLYSQPCAHWCKYFLRLKTTGFQISHFSAQHYTDENPS